MHSSNDKVVVVVFCYFLLKADARWSGSKKSEWGRGERQLQYFYSTVAGGAKFAAPAANRQLEGRSRRGVKRKERKWRRDLFLHLHESQ